MVIAPGRVAHTSRSTMLRVPHPLRFLQRVRVLTFISSEWRERARHPKGRAAPSPKFRSGFSPCRPLKKKILHPNKGHVERLRETSLCANFSARWPPCGIPRLKAPGADVFLECGLSRAKPRGRLVYPVYPELRGEPRRAAAFEV